MAAVPQIFDDYGGNYFAGEAGALAVNDNWATTVYDYTPKNIPAVVLTDIASLPTPTGSPAKPGSSGVNPNASDEYLVIDRAGLAAALNNATYDKIFIAKGSECTNGADSDEMTLTVGGTSSDKRWFIYWDPDTPSNVTSVEPWNQAQADRANMPRIRLDNADWTRWVGLSWGEIGQQVMRCAIMENGASNNLHYRCNMENGTDHVWTVRHSGCDDNMAYMCVSHEHDSNTPNGDTHCFVSLNGDGTKVISCEGWDFLGDFFHIEDGGSNGCVCEDNDIYRKTFYDGSGNVDANGEYGGGEGAIDLKSLNPDNTSVCRVWGNRIWDMRKPDSVIHAGGGRGTPISFSNNDSTKFGLDARWNIIFDSTDGGIDLRANLGIANEPGSHSIVRNVLSNIEGPPRS